MSHFLTSCNTTALLALSLLASGPVFAQHLPAAQTAGAVQYRCGGIGLDESTAMRGAVKDYPLALLFAGAGGEYLADVKVDIAGASQAAFTASGPVCLLRLPEGHYTVKATTKEGQGKSQSVHVDSGSKSLDFRF